MEKFITPLDTLFLCYTILLLRIALLKSSLNLLHSTLWLLSLLTSSATRQTRFILPSLQLHFEQLSGVMASSLGLLHTIYSNLCNSSLEFVHFRSLTTDHFGSTFLNHFYLPIPLEQDSVFYCQVVGNNNSNFPGSADCISPDVVSLI